MCDSMSEFVRDYESIILFVIYRILKIIDQDIYHCIFLLCTSFEHFYYISSIMFKNVI